jgi:predicted transcriptional regulator
MSVNQGTSPPGGSGTSDGVPPPLVEINEKLLRGEIPEKLPVRRFIGWWGYERRGYKKVSTIRQTLKRLGIRTDPDFDAVHIDDTIGFDAEPKAGSSDVVENVTVMPTFEPVVYVGGAVHDPTYRIGKLASANLLASPAAELVRVSPNTSLREVVTRMLSKGVSHVPVMTGEREVKGVVTWSSIGKRLGLGCSGTEARDFMEQPVQIVESKTNLFKAVGTIVEHGYVLVMSEDRTITGIVTATDLSLQFRQLGEPFLLLGEIENHVRRLIADKFTKTELRQFRDPSAGDEPFDDVADLTFGDYVRILQTEPNWKRIDLAVDRDVFIKDLDRVREIRNEVMHFHFDPDGLEPEYVGFLQQFVRFLQTLDEFGAL